MRLVAIREKRGRIIFLLTGLIRHPAFPISLPGKSLLKNENAW
jgi:hypothetical protein